MSGHRRRSHALDEGGYHCAAVSSSGQQLQAPAEKPPQMLAILSPMLLVVVLTAACVLRLLQPPPSHGTVSLHPHLPPPAPALRVAQRVPAPGRQLAKAAVPLAAAVAAATFSAPAGAAPGPAAPTDVQQLQQQLTQLEERVDSLRAELQRLEGKADAPGVAVDAPPPEQKTMTLQRGTYNPVSISFVLMSGIGMLTLVIVLERTLPMWFQKMFPSVGESNRQLAQYREQNSYSKTVTISLNPENINGRSAMLGFLAGVGTELITGHPLTQQLADNPMGVAATAGLVTLGSVMPVLTMSATDGSLGLNGKGEGQQRWTPEAEKLNGQAAMVGLSGVVLLETLLGGALFPHP